MTCVIRDLTQLAHLAYVGLMLGQSRRIWANVKSTMDKLDVSCYFVLLRLGTHI